MTVMTAGAALPVLVAVRIFSGYIDLNWVKGASYEDLSNKRDSLLPSSFQLVLTNQY